MTVDEYGDEIGKPRTNYATMVVNKQLREMAEETLRKRLAKYIGLTITPEVREQMVKDLVGFL